MNGVEYVPGGVAEIDELYDLYAIWAEQDKLAEIERKQAGTGVDPSVYEADD